MRDLDSARSGRVSFLCFRGVARSHVVSDCGCLRSLLLAGTGPTNVHSRDATDEIALRRDCHF